MDEMDTFRARATREEEDAAAVIRLQHRKTKKEVSEKYYWKLKPDQIQMVIDLVWQ